MFVIKRHTMQTQETLEVWFHTFLTAAPNAGDWSA